MMRTKSLSMKKDQTLSMWRMSHHIQTLMLLVMSTALAGCMPSRPMPVIVEVADARTGDPLPGVIVRAAGGTFYIPTMQPSMLGAPGSTFGPLPDPEGAVGETDAQGRAYMTVSGQRPVSLRFFKTGYPEGHLTVTTGEQQILGATAWTTEPGIPGVVRSVPLAGAEDPFLSDTPLQMMFRVTATPEPVDTTASAER